MRINAKTPDSCPGYASSSMIETPVRNAIKPPCRRSTDQGRASCRSENHQWQSTRSAYTKQFSETYGKGKPPGRRSAAGGKVDFITRYFGEDRRTAAVLPQLY